MPDNKSHDGEASVFIFGHPYMVFDYQERFPRLSFDDRAWQISEHYKGVWYKTRCPIKPMEGWLRNYAEEHKKGIELAKTLGVQFVE